MQLNEFAMKRTWGPTPKLERVMAYEPPKDEFTVIAGPCSIEHFDQIVFLAEHVADAGGTHMRGGVFRAGTYPSDKFGLIDEITIKAYYDNAQLNGLQNIIEILDYTEHMVDKVAQYCTAFQVGCRQMQNYTLLRELGGWGKPVFLKRHPGTTIDEFLGAAEHLLAGGVKELYLIERGSVSHSKHVRWDLSISMIPAVKAITKIPIIVDASHGTGRRDLVEPMTLAGVAAGADGLLVEFHEEPEKSLSDSEQALSIPEFQKLMTKVNNLREVL